MAASDRGVGGAIHCAGLIQRIRLRAALRFWRLFMRSANAKSFAPRCGAEIEYADVEWRDTRGAVRRSRVVLERPQLIAREGRHYLPVRYFESDATRRPITMSAPMVARAGVGVRGRCGVLDGPQDVTHFTFLLVSNVLLWGTTSNS
jgi:hypothetical protein